MPENQWKCKIVTCSHVKSAKIVLDMPHSALHGHSIVPTVHLSRDAAENLVNCAEAMDDTTIRFGLMITKIPKNCNRFP